MLNSQFINSDDRRCSRGKTYCPGYSRFAYHPARGFTLIELLVVISIIAILLAIIMPSLKAVKDQAKKVICFSNMRQTGIALQLYLMDSDDHLPPSSCNITDPDQFWLKVLSDYTNEQILFHCPADTGKNFVDWNSSLSDQTDKRYSSFALNALLDPVNVRYTGTTNKYNKVSNVHDPKFCIWISEAPNTDAFLQADHIHPELWGGAPDYAKTFVAYDRHRGKSNYLFADGHAETLEFEETYAWPGHCYWYPETAPLWPDNP